MDSGPQLVIVGAGPAGLAAAHAAALQGVQDVLVIDRDDAPGGLPRFCDHPGFGLEYVNWPYRGPAFARRLMRDLAGTNVAVECATTLISVREGPAIEIVGPRLGNRTLRPKALVLATGIRESNRGNLMIPGARPEQGILTTGQLQQLVARKVALPDHIRRLAVIGTEHVAFSALMTARHGGFRVSHMIGAEDSIRSIAPARWMARAFGADLILGARLREIIARNDQVTAIRCETAEGLIDLACDGVVLTGGWIPEIAALSGSGIAVDPKTRGPVIDQAMRTSLPGIFAAGNMLRPVESSGWAAVEGYRAGHLAARFIQGRLEPRQSAACLTAGDGIDYVVPQRWDPALATDRGVPALKPSIRVSRDIGRARLCLSQDAVTAWTGSPRRLRPHRRIKLDLEGIMNGREGDWQLSVMPR
ncbi:FAD-dependent oxidoreductase [Taklimakanibacter deserti]|uniref:FAD-dependent oxidoreductase n=1 Tax=Taklimakanibacter deserti TaxID=2267839 RepID=UPI0013C44877